MVLKVLHKIPPTLVLVHGWLFPVLGHVWHLQFVRQCASHLYRCAFLEDLDLSPQERAPCNTLEYAYHVYGSTPPFVWQYF